MNFNELTLDNIGTWPLAARTLVIGIICSLTLSLFYVFDVRLMCLKLQQAIKHEADLRVLYQVKFSQTLNRNIYQKHISALQDYIKNILEQLPEQIDVPGLLYDISRLGSQTGLHFNYIKPIQTVNHDDYTELPIAISVKGNYTQLTDFITQLANMPRIVTLGNFDISRLPTKNTLLGTYTPPPLTLVMNLTINAYQQRNETNTPVVSNSHV